MSKLDWSNRLTDGLVFAYVPTCRSSIDHVSGKAPTSFGGTVSEIEHPMRFVSGNADFGRTGADDITTEGTVLALVDWDATVTSDVILSSWQPASTGGFKFWMDDNSYISHGLIVETWSQRRQSNFDIFDSNRFYTLGAAWNGTDCRFYVDGKLKTTDSGSAISPGVHADRVTRIGIDRYDAMQLTGKIAYVYAWNRKLSAAEIAAVTAEPYQFFIGTPEFVAVEPRSDTFRLLEAPAAEGTINTSTLSDIISPTDSYLREAIKEILSGDTIALTDTYLREAIKEVLFADNVTLTDSVIESYVTQALESYVQSVSHIGFVEPFP